MMLLRDWSVFIANVPDLQDGVASIRSTASTVASRLVGVMSTVLIGAVIVGWSLFWGSVAQLHYSQGDVVSAVFTATTLVAPAVGGLLWYLGTQLETDAVPPDVELRITSS